MPTQSGLAPPTRDQEGVSLPSLETPSLPKGKQSLTLGISLCPAHSLPRSHRFSRWWPGLIFDDLPCAASVRLIQPRVWCVCVCVSVYCDRSPAPPVVRSVPPGLVILQQQREVQNRRKNKEKGRKGGLSRCQSLFSSLAFSFLSSIFALFRSRSIDIQYQQQPDLRLPVIAPAFFHHEEVRRMS